MKVHQGSGILPFSLLGVYKGTGELDPIVNVVAAATPVEGAFAVLGTSFLLGVAGTGLEFSLATGPGDGKYNAS